MFTCHYRSGPQALAAVSACWQCGKLWQTEPPRHIGVSSFVSNKQMKWRVNGMPPGEQDITHTLVVSKLPYHQQ